MRPKRYRLLFVLVGMVLLGVAATLVLLAFDENLVFFVSPTEVAAKKPAPSVRFRLGGLIEERSIQRNGLTTTFRVTDLSHAVAVTYTGLLPDLFREGQGVITEGRLGPDGVFVASTVLAKHDET
ncbi:MAG: cytochrome c maturation protein CcmE, partial [Alphaproteobacteria bacterium]|nr:cytochrome c maturation protein CcmE [Alphaproteobacteria bacterium]